MSIGEAFLYAILAIVGFPTIGIIIIAVNTDIIETWLANRGKR